MLFMHSGPMSKAPTCSGAGKQAFQQLQGRQVQPLKIVQDQDQGMLRTGEEAEESWKQQSEPAPCGLRRQVRRERLLANQKLEVRDGR
jgi:hypothetical protein